MLRFVRRPQLSSRKKTEIRILAILFALISTGIFVSILGYNPLVVYWDIIIGAVGSSYRIKETIIEAVPLIITALGIMIAFKMKFWNIGGEGQIIMGAFAASYAALNFPNIARPLLLLIMFIIAFVAGGIWGIIPAFFRARFGANETILTLMMNYIALKWITYLQYGPWRDPASLGFPKIADFSQNALLPNLFGVHIGWIIAIVLTLIIHYFMNHSKKGYEISVIGESEDTARYAGMNIRQVIITAMLLSGGICGLTGMIQASSVCRTLSVEVSGGYGFTAIIIAWLSGLSAPVAVLVAVLFAILTQGGSYVQTALQIPQAVVNILQATILFCVLGSQFFINYRLTKQISLSTNIKEAG